MCLLLSCVPLCHVPCHMTLCPASWGACVAWVHSPGAPAQPQPVPSALAAGAAAPSSHSHLWGPSLASPHSRGLAPCPATLVLPRALTDPQALPLLAQGGYPPLSPRQNKLDPGQTAGGGRNERRELEKQSVYLTWNLYSEYIKSNYKSTTARQCNRNRQTLWTDTLPKKRTTVREHLHAH